MGNQCCRCKGGSNRPEVKSSNGQIMHRSQQKERYYKFYSNDRHMLSVPHESEAFSVGESGTETKNKRKTMTTTLKNRQQQEVFVNQQHQHKRDDYMVPSIRDLDANWKFYQNKLKSNILGLRIEDILKWFGHYDTLEKTHDFIQWLFPIPDSSSVNHFAKPLSPEEASKIRNDQQCSERVLRAYEMMLDFYGMTLKSINTGEIDRSDNYIERYRNLNRSSHNYKRITRILTSLGHLGYEHFQGPWVDFLINEVVVNKELPNIRIRSLVFWVGAVDDNNEKEYLFKKLSNLTQSKEFHEYEAYDYKKRVDAERHKMAEPSSENKCQEITNSQDLRPRAIECMQTTNIEATYQASDADNKDICTAHQVSSKPDNKAICTAYHASSESAHETLCTAHQACETDNKAMYKTYQASSKTDNEAIDTEHQCSSDAANKVTYTDQINVEV